LKFIGKGLVWDKETDRQLCRFNKQGEFETTDEDVVQKLLALGYVSTAPNYIDVEFTEVEPEPEVEVEVVPEVPKEKPKRSHKKKEAVL
jgi:hypothetical protein